MLFPFSGLGQDPLKPSSQIQNPVYCHYEPFTTRLKFGERCFSYAGPKAWNALPAELQDLTDHSAFKRQLKTFLFERAFTT